MAPRVSRRKVLIGGLGLAGAAAAAPLLTRTAFAGTAAAAAVSPDDLPWPEAKKIVADTTLPSFPDVTFKVADYGAKNDGKTDNTAAFKSAIEACSAAG